MSWQPYLYLRGLLSQNKAMAYILISIFSSVSWAYLSENPENIHIFEVIFLEIFTVLY